jgi:hypothetical protein
VNVSFRSHVLTPLYPNTKTALPRYRDKVRPISC